MIFLIFLLLILIVLSAFFSCTETVLYLTNEHDLNKKSKNYKKYLLIKNNQDDILVIILFSNTIVNIFIGLITERLGYKIFPEDTNIFIIILLSTLILLIFGEILPKKLGISLHEKLYNFNFIIVFYLSEFLKNINKFISIIIYPIKFLKKENYSFEKSELKNILKDGLNSKIFNSLEYSIYNNLLNFTEYKVKDLMVPYKDIDYINYRTEIFDFIKTLYSSYEFCIPVYDEKDDFIYGYIDKRDLVSYIKSEYNNIFNNKNKSEEIEIVKDLINKFLKKPYIIYEKINVKNVISDIFFKSNQIIFVVDDYFQLSGVIYLDYLIEKVFKVYNV